MSMEQDYNTLLAIVNRLAAVGSPTHYDDMYGCYECSLCGKTQPRGEFNKPFPHEDTCPWQMAQEIDVSSYDCNQVVDADTFMIPSLSGYPPDKAFWRVKKEDVLSEDVAIIRGMVIVTTKFQVKFIHELK